MANPDNPQAVAQASRKITVNADTRKPVITIESSKANTALTGTPYDVYAGVKASLDQTDLTSAVTVKVTNANNQTVAVTNKMVTFTEAGVYTITYTVQNPNNPAVVETKTFTVTVSVQNTTPDDAPAVQSAPEFMNPNHEEPAEDGSEPEVSAEAEVQPKEAAEDEVQPDEPAGDEPQPEAEVQPEVPAEDTVEPEVPAEVEVQPEPEVLP